MCTSGWGICLYCFRKFCVLLHEKLCLSLKLSLSGPVSVPGLGSSFSVLEEENTVAPLSFVSSILGHFSPYFRI